LQGQYAKRYRTACGKINKTFRFYHRRSMIEFEGFVTPAPATHFAVRLQLKKCVGGTWRKIGNRFTTGKPVTGKYRGFFRARPLAPHKRHAVRYYRARAIVGGTRTPYEYFAVTR